MKTFIIILLGVTMTGCTAYQYVASPPYVPLHKKKGEVVLNLSLNSAQAGYSITDHVSLFSTAYIFEGGSFPLSEDESRFLEGTIGAGYFRKYGALYSSVLVGGGLGQVSYSNSIAGSSNYAFNMNADKMNFYIQPQVSHVLNKYFEVSGFLKFNYNEYYHINSSLYKIEFETEFTPAIQKHYEYSLTETVGICFL
jgi:hypothetical protein